MEFSKVITIIEKRISKSKERFNGLDELDLNNRIRELALQNALVTIQQDILEEEIMARGI